MPIQNFEFQSQFLAQCSRHYLGRYIGGDDRNKIHFKKSSGHFTNDHDSWTMSLSPQIRNTGGIYVGGRDQQYCNELLHKKAVFTFSHPYILLGN
jgi:hypothetical protein